MLKKLVAVALLGSTLAVVGCQSVPDSTTSTNLTILQNKTWVATKIGNSAIITNPTERNIPSLQFDEATQRVSGSDGCNRIMGGYKAGKDTITFDQLATTQMACMNNANIDQLFNTALSKVTNYQAFGKTLKLLDRNGNSLIEFESAVQPR
jgi:heat shock protein HslJ